MPMPNGLLSAIVMPVMAFPKRSSASPCGSYISKVTYAANSPLWSANPPTITTAATVGGFR